MIACAHFTLCVRSVPTRAAHVHPAPSYRERGYLTGEGKNWTRRVPLSPFPSEEKRMRRQVLLGVLVALASAAAAQPAAAQWYDRGNRGGFGVSVGFGSPGYYDYGYAGYGSRCTYAPGAYASSYPRASYGYAYAPSSSSYAYSRYGYDYGYPGYGYASVGIGVTDRSWRTSRFYRDDGRTVSGRVAIRDRDFDRSDRVRQRTAVRGEVATESRAGVRARGEGAIRAEGSGGTTVRSGATVQGRAAVNATEGRGSGARIERRDGAPMRTAPAGRER